MARLVAGRLHEGSGRLSPDGRGAETRSRFLRLHAMTQQILDTPLQADVIDGGVVITGPNGFQSTMTLDAAKATVARLQAVLGAVGEPETYQKPLG
jgi:hypothetical protein